MTKRYRTNDPRGRTVAKSLVVAAVMVFALAASLRAADESPPNIIIILSDNLGYGELGCYGGYRRVPTPRIDALAAEGLRLTNFNVETWCAPSRSALLTGRFGVRSGTDQETNKIKGMTQWEI